MKKITTLCIVHKDNKVLLGMKKRGFGKGRWNGFGGKVSEGESIETATRRELTEEAGIKTKNLAPIGVLNFDIADTQELIEVHLFKSTDYEGEISESEEMKPEWFDVDKIPFAEMWPDDQYWMPYFLGDKKFKAEFKFADYNTLIEHTIKQAI